MSQRCCFDLGSGTRHREQENIKSARLVPAIHTASLHCGLCESDLHVHTRIQEAIMWAQGYGEVSAGRSEPWQGYDLLGHLQACREILDDLHDKMQNFVYNGGLDKLLAREQPADSVNAGGDMCKIDGDEEGDAAASRRKRMRTPPKSRPVAATARPARASALLPCQTKAWDGTGRLDRPRAWV